MKKKLLQGLALCLTLGSIWTLPVSAAPTQDPDDPIVKIGLAYGNNARPAPKLLNVAGQDTGYDFGWYDKNDHFHEVAYTDLRDLVLLKDTFIYMAKDETFSDQLVNNQVRTILPYHLETKESFSDFEEAAEIAEEFRDALGETAFPAYVDDEYVVRAGEYGSLSAAKLAAEDMEAELGYDFKAVGGSTTCYTVAECSTGDLLFEFDQGGQPLGVQPWSEETWFAGYKYNGGFEYNRVNGNDLTVINVIGIHDYIKGVITGEMSPDWEQEALKAQALCAKSYAYCSRGKHSSLGFDLCNTTDCQVYYGTGQQNKNSSDAVDDTYGLFIFYDGEVVPTFYHASSGGWTEDAENVWGKEQGYLKAVKDTHLTKTLPYSFTITNSQIKSILKAKGYSIQSDIVDFYVSEETDAGNVRAITFVQKNGKELTFTGEKARTILNGSSYGYRINSQRFTVTPGGGGNSGSAEDTIPVNGSWISKLLTKLYAIGANGVKKLTLDTDEATVLTADGEIPLSDLGETKTTSSGNASGTYLVQGTGSGHNIGMSQWGAKAMAEKGYDFEEILEFYFTDIEIDRLD